MCERMTWSELVESPRGDFMEVSLESLVDDGSFEPSVVGGIGPDITGLTYCVPHCIVYYMAHRDTQSTAKAGTQELRRGAIVLAILAQLRTEHYGYSLREKLAAGGLAVNEGTLYPLLRRLETQGLLSSDWDLGAGRPRRYYRISRTGRRMLADLKAEWQSLVEVMDRMLAPEGEDRT